MNWSSLSDSSLILASPQSSNLTNPRSLKYIRKSKHQTLILYHKLILSITNQNQISTLLTYSTQISLTKLKHAQRELIFHVYICLQGASKADLINITTEDMKIERFLRQTTSKCFHMNLLRVHKEDRFLKKSLTDFSFCDCMETIKASLEMLLIIFSIPFSKYLKRILGTCQRFLKQI